MNRPYSGWKVGTESLCTDAYSDARRRKREDDVRLAAIGDNVVDYRLQLGEDLGLAEGKFSVLLVIVEDGDHVLDLRARGAGYVREARHGGQSCRG